MDITVILPCAGEGRRLNLGHPKELYEIRNGLKLIDFSLFHIIKNINNNNFNIKISVVITPEKEEVYKYVKNLLPSSEINKIYFNKKFKEWPGSVFSARESFSEYNIVLLPDSYLSLSKTSHFFSENGRSLIEIIINKLNGFNAVFGYVKTKKREKLKNLGAMNVEGGKVIRFKDKPQTKHHLYNSFWGCYGFKKDIGEKLYQYLHKSVFNNDIEAELIPPFSMGGVPIYSFFDLGTWSGINEFLSSESNSSSSITCKTQ